MVHTNLDAHHVVIDGQFVNADVERVVLAIKDYEPEIEVQWLPVGARDENQPAFKIVHNDPRNGPFTLMYVKDESEFDMRVLKRIIANDQRNGKVTLSEFEAWEEANKLIEKQKYLDQLEEANDIAAHVLRSPLNNYKVNEDLVIKDGIPFNAKGY